MNNINKNNTLNHLLNQILYGPPGTGKTFSIKEKVHEILVAYGEDIPDNLIESLKAEDRLAFTTFHPAYGYEEFIEGIRPNLDGETISYHIHDGTFKELCEHSKIQDLDKGKNQEKPYFMIIDEINRGNIPKIFGELITLIEDNKRAGMEEEISVTLPYSGESFSVPKNVHIIGTMNTTDKSLVSLDIALRRRFNFIEMMPDCEVLKKKLPDDLSWVADYLGDINERIEKDLGRSHTIGHAFFINNKTIADVKHALQYKVIPLLQEYEYDDWGKIGVILKVEIQEPVDFGTVADDVIKKHDITERHEKHEHTKQEVEPVKSKRVRGPKMKLTDLGIENGRILYFTEDPNITATVKNNELNSIEININNDAEQGKIKAEYSKQYKEMIGKIYSYSGAAKTLLDKEVQGGKYWSLDKDGKKTLLEYKKEISA